MASSIHPTDAEPQQQETKTARRRALAPENLTPRQLHPARSSDSDAVYDSPMKVGHENTEPVHIQIDFTPNNEKPTENDKERKSKSRKRLSKQRVKKRSTTFATYSETDEEYSTEPIRESTRRKSQFKNVSQVDIHPFQERVRLLEDTIIQNFEQSRIDREQQQHTAMMLGKLTESISMLVHESADRQPRNRQDLLSRPSNGTSAEKESQDMFKLNPRSRENILKNLPPEYHPSQHVLIAHLRITVESFMRAAGYSFCEQMFVIYQVFRGSASNLEASEKVLRPFSKKLPENQFHARLTVYRKLASIIDQKSTHLDLSHENMIHCLRPKQNETVVDTFEKVKILVEEQYLLDEVILSPERLDNKSLEYLIKNKVLGERTTKMLMDQVNITRTALGLLPKQPINSSRIDFCLRSIAYKSIDDSPERFESNFSLLGNPPSSQKLNPGSKKAARCFKCESTYHFLKDCPYVEKREDSGPRQNTKIDPPKKMENTKAFSEIRKWDDLQENTKRTVSFSLMSTDKIPPQYHQKFQTFLNSSTDLKSNKQIMQYLPKNNTPDQFLFLDVIVSDPATTLSLHAKIILDTALTADGVIDPEIVRERGWEKMTEKLDYPIMMQVANHEEIMSNRKLTIKCAHRGVDRDIEFLVLSQPAGLLLGLAGFRKFFDQSELLEQEELTKNFDRTVQKPVDCSH